MPAVSQSCPAMPPNEKCPNCLQNVEDWHLEWYKTEGPAAFIAGLQQWTARFAGRLSDFSKE